MTRTPEETILSNRLMNKLVHMNDYQIRSVFFYVFGYLEEYKDDRFFEDVEKFMAKVATE